MSKDETQGQDNFDADLHPHSAAGMNQGGEGPRTRPASDIKELQDRLAGYREDELRNMLVIRTGERLKQGAVYLDLMHPEEGEIKATGDMEAGPWNHYIAKHEHDYVLWNRLLGIHNPARLDEEEK
ncbi:MAG: hypothetical protein M3Y56_13970 [Armatimonadota bacterium]|nr:hypothetical protein [Armatimonadota bacterium]